MKHKRYPQIRFKGFNNPWEQCKLKEISTIQAGGDIDNKKIVDSGKYPVIANALTNDGIVGYYNYEYRIKAPAVTVTGRGDVGHAQARMVNFTPVVRLLALNTEHNVNFIANAINTKRIVVESTGVPQLTVPQLENYEIKVTLENEENKIGKLFVKLDNLIILHQKKHDKLIEIKKSLLEKMFPKNNEKIPEIRFKGFTYTWKQHKLDDFGKSTGGVSIESEFTNHGKYKVISIGSYSEMSRYNDQGIRCKLSNKTKDKVLNKDDITMILNDKTSSGNIIGRVLLIDKSGEYVYNQRTERIEINKKEYNPLFVYELLNAPNIRKKIINESQGNTQIYVNWTKIKELLYYVPDIKEQEKLGIYFKNIDNLINLHQIKVKKLKKLKESLLRKMFI